MLNLNPVPRTPNALNAAHGIERDFAGLVLPRFKHMLVVFGGQPSGLAEIMQREGPLAHKTPEVGGCLGKPRGATFRV